MKQQKPSATAGLRGDTSPGAQTGKQAFTSYFSSDIDKIGLYNGNVLLELSILSFPGREIPIDLILSYNSQKWELVDCSGIPCGEYTGGWRITTGFGAPPREMDGVIPIVRRAADLLAGCTSIPQYDLNAYWMDAFGTKHRYKLANIAGSGSCASPVEPSWIDRTLASLDTDASVYYSGSDDQRTGEKITFKNGNVLQMYPTARLTTPNGNYVVREDNSKLPLQDTLGRTITYETNFSISPNTYYRRSTVTDANHALQTYQLNFEAKESGPIVDAGCHRIEQPGEESAHSDGDHHAGRQHTVE